MGLWLEINQDLETNQDLGTKQGSHTSRFKRMTFRVFKVSRFFQEPTMQSKNFKKLPRQLQDSRTTRNKHKVWEKKFRMNNTATVAAMNSTATVCEQYQWTVSLNFFSCRFNTSYYDRFWQTTKQDATQNKTRLETQRGNKEWAVEFQTLRWQFFFFFFRIG